MHFSVTTITVYFCVQLCFLFIITYEVFIFILLISVLFGEYSVINIFRYMLPHWSSRLHIIRCLFRSMVMSILFQYVFMLFIFFIFLCNSIFLSSYTYYSINHLMFTSF